jgi:hypothetical protein
MLHDKKSKKKWGPTIKKKLEKKKEERQPEGHEKESQKKVARKKSRWRGKTRHK